MKALTPHEVQGAVERLERAAKDGDTPTWRAEHARLRVPAAVNLPLGELTNPEIAGWLWAWGQLGAVGEPFRPPARITGITMQGLEWFVPITGLLLVDALLLAQWVGADRVQVHVCGTTSPVNPEL